MPFQYSNLPPFQDSVEELFQYSTLGSEALPLRYEYESDKGLHTHIGKVVVAVLTPIGDARVIPYELAGAALYTDEEDDIHVAVGTHRAGEGGRLLRLAAPQFLIGGADYDPLIEDWKINPDIYDQSGLWGRLTLEEMNAHMQRMATRGRNPLHDSRAREHMRAVMAQGRVKFVEPLLKLAVDRIAAEITTT